MIKKILLLYFICFINSSFFSQERRILVNGKVTDSLGTVKNANIINLRTDQGTFSSDNGIFRIFVKEDDSLQVSSIQYTTEFIVINKDNVINKAVNIKLTYNTFVLDTLELKRHHLSGRLGIDSKSVSINRKDSLLRELLDFSKVNMKIVEEEDDIDKMKPPMNNTDPARTFVGVGTSGVIPFRDSERLWALRKKLAQKKAFPYNILLELGEKFFFEQLKIPIDRYFHFLEYCNPLGIETLYKDRKILDIIKIFQSEGKSYLEIIKKE